MIGPEVPQRIQDIRAKRLGRAVAQDQSESSDDDDDFAGPSLEDFRGDVDEKYEQERAARERFSKASIEQFERERDASLNENDLKHDSWMSMKPQWDRKPLVKTTNSQPKPSENREAIERSKKPSLLEQHQQNRKKQGADEKENVTYNSEESLNAEVRKEVFRKASSLSDRFTKGS